MAKTIKGVLSNSNPYSKAIYKYEKTRSDGQLPDKKSKPTTKGDKVIHNSHIVDSGQYNLRHEHDHLEELIFDYERLSKERPEEAEKLQYQALKFLAPLYKRMGLKMEKMNG